MNKYIIPSVLAMFVFSGCVSVTKDLPPFSTYTLSVDTNNTKQTKKTGYSVSVLEPKTINSVNDLLISYSDNLRSEHYALSKWSDKPTKMLQHMMVTYLSATNNYNYVHSNKLNIPSDIYLQSELDSFTQYLQDDKAYVEFTIRVFLLQQNTLYTKKFTYKFASEDQSAYSSVKAMNKAVNQFLKELDSWMVHIK